MKTLICATALALTFATGASAQSDAAKSTSAVKTAHTVNDGAAEPGRNSFTEKQAREHIANSGYASVSALKKDKDGIWRGTATKDGQKVHVALDFKGNVSTEQ
jgi:hypothetical protein